ncbi:MAG: RDD family protein [Pseudomonadota bacterium]
MGRVWVALIVVALSGVTLLATTNGGVQDYCGSKDCAVHAATSPLSLVASVCLLVFVLVHAHESAEPDRTDPVSFRRRFVGFLIDFCVGLCACVPLLVVPVLLIEARQSGVFRWEFSRDYGRPTDVVIVLIVFLTFGALFAYFYAHARIGRQTVGQYVLGYQIEPLPGAKPQYAANVILGYIGLCMWPISLFLAARRIDKAFWWSLRTGTRVVGVRQT